MTGVLGRNRQGACRDGPDGQRHEAQDKGDDGAHDGPRVITGVCMHCKTSASDHETVCLQLSLGLIAPEGNSCGSPRSQDATLLFMGRPMMHLQAVAPNSTCSPVEDGGRLPERAPHRDLCASCCHDTFAGMGVAAVPGWAARPGVSS